MNITLLRQPLGSVAGSMAGAGSLRRRERAPAELRGTSLEEVVKRLIAEKDVTGSLGELTPLLRRRRIPGCGLAAGGAWPSRPL